MQFPLNHSCMPLVIRNLIFFCEFICLWVQFSFSVVSDSLWPYGPQRREKDPRETPGLSVHHQLPEFTQTHVHQVGDAIQPSHPLLSPSPPAPVLNHLNECINFKLSSSILSQEIWSSVLFLHYSSKNSLPPFKYRGGLIKPIATVKRFQWNG